MVGLARVCGNSYLPLDQSELGAQIGRTQSLWPILPRVHYPGKGGGADLLLQKGGPIVDINLLSVITVKGIAILLATVHLRISKR